MAEFIYVMVVATCLEFATALNYSRETLQKQFPGFGDKWIPLLNDKGDSTIGYFEEPPGETRFSFLENPEDVVYFTLYNRDIVNGVIINSTKKLGKQFNRKKTVKFVTHGWLSSGHSSTCVKIKDGFLKKYDSNVFIMDWSKIAGNIFYPIPMRATTNVANFYSKFLNNLVDLGVNPKNIHLVGHSLGAHISGFAARNVKKATVGRVTGLDPALPGFDVGMVDGGRLKNSDADFVDVIHTCGGYLGMEMSVGHADFYPNGGKPPQPGCENIFEMIEACSHGRSWLYFAESLTSSIPFMAFPCDSFEHFINKNNCKKNGVAMGDPAPRNARGNFYLHTDVLSPFAEKDVDNKIK